MTSNKFLDFLPINFRHEKDFLIRNNLLDFERLSILTDNEINNIQRNSPLCTLNNLKKIRAIAIFKKQIAISPPEAYLLLHCGVSSIRALSQFTPHELTNKIGRLERKLSSKTGANITYRILKNWIQRAKEINTSN